MTDIDNLKELFAKATPGKWIHWGRKGADQDHYVQAGDRRVARFGDAIYHDSPDAELTVALHNAFPALASELEAARKVVAEMREMVDQCDLTITWRNERGMKPATDISIFAPTALSGVIKIKRYFEQALAEYLRVMEEQR